MVCNDPDNEDNYLKMKDKDNNAKQQFEQGPTLVIVPASHSRWPVIHLVSCLAPPNVWQMLGQVKNQVPRAFLILIPPMIITTY